jgi:hypothetical protein
MRRSLRFLLFIFAGSAIFITMPFHARFIQQREDVRLRQMQNLHVTDLCLVTEARYTRHPAMADRHAPFQEHPLALEHFPSGSLILPNLLNQDKP